MRGSTPLLALLALPPTLDGAGGAEWVPTPSSASGGSSEVTLLRRASPGLIPVARWSRRPLTLGCGQQEGATRVQSPPPPTLPSDSPSVRTTSRAGHEAGDLRCGFFIRLLLSRSFRSLLSLAALDGALPHLSRNLATARGARHGASGSVLNTSHSVNVTSRRWWR